jgi:predicted phage terminase large subunit-like protein
MNLEYEADGTKAQAAFVHAEEPFPAFVGGYGSGKTHALCLRALFLLFRDKANLAYYMPSWDLVRNVAYPRLKEMLQNTGITVVGNLTNFTLTTDYGKIIFRTTEDPERLVGYEVGHSLLDELDTLPAHKAEMVWDKALSRNRTKLPNNQINTMAVGTTPEGFRFVYEQWGRDVIDAESKGYKLYRGRTYDNPHLPASYIKNLENRYPAQLLQAYLNGEFVNLNDGIIQRNWFKPSTQTQLTKISMGVDLAISLKDGADSTAIVVGGTDDKGVFHVLDAQAKRVSFHEAQEFIKQVANKWQPKIINVEAVQYQLAAVQELMRTTRLPVVAVRPDKDKASRLMPLAARYEQGMVAHAPANSTNAIRVLEDELTSFPNGAHDDLVDALVYCWNGQQTTGGFSSSGKRIF